MYQTRFHYACLACALILLKAPVHAQMTPMLDRAATLVLKVNDYQSARLTVIDEARMQNGELMDARTQVNEKGKKHGWMRFVVPAAQLPMLLASLHAEGKLSAENVDTTDNLSEYEELQRRVERLQQHEQRLDGILQSPRRMRGSDVLYLQERLFRASVDESLLSQQRVDMERSAHASTLIVQLFEPGSLPPGMPQRVNLKDWFASAVQIGHAGQDRTMARAATAGAYAAVYAPFWVPIAVLAIALSYALWRLRFVLVTRVIVIGNITLTLLVRLIGWLRTAWNTRHEPLSLR